MSYFANILVLLNTHVISCFNQMSNQKSKEQGSNCSHRENHSLENWVHLQQFQENRADRRENCPSPPFLHLSPPLQGVGNLRWRTYRSFRDKHGLLTKSVDYQTWLETDLSGRMARRPYSPDSLAALSRLWSLPPRSCSGTWSQRRSTAPYTHQPRSQSVWTAVLLAFDLI